MNVLVIYYGMQLEDKNLDFTKKRQYSKNRLYESIKESTIDSNQTNYQSAGPGLLKPMNNPES